MPKVNKKYPVGRSIIESNNHEYKIDRYDEENNKYVCHTVEWRNGEPVDKPGHFSKTPEEILKDFSKFFNQHFTFEEDKIEKPSFTLNSLKQDYNARKTEIIENGAKKKDDKPVLSLDELIQEATRKVKEDVARDASVTKQKDEMEI